jgi:hypothetical protein
MMTTASQIWPGEMAFSCSHHCSRAQGIALAVSVQKFVLFFHSFWMIVGLLSSLLPLDDALLLQSATMLQKCNNQPFEKHKSGDKKPRDESRVVTIRALRRRENAIGASRVNSSDGIEIMISCSWWIFVFVGVNTHYPSLQWCKNA